MLIEIFVFYDYDGLWMPNEGLTQQNPKETSSILQLKHWDIEAELSILSPFDSWNFSHRPLGVP
jgi:hypothetical protein